MPIIALAIASATPAWPVAQTLQINGAGATFPYPIYSAWFTEYGKARPDVQINYLSIGSGAGIQQLTDEIVFFAATDTPMTDDELLEAPGRILQLPTVIGAVAPIYNVPGIKGELRFSGPVLADIFLGRITNWNDPAIASLKAAWRYLPPTSLRSIAPRAPARRSSGRISCPRSLPNGGG